MNRILYGHLPKIRYIELRPEHFHVRPVKSETYTLMETILFAGRSIKAKRAFYQTTRLVVTYEGLIENFVGDAVMVLFRVPKSHEDDPVRAIKAAKETHTRLCHPQLAFQGNRAIGADHTVLDSREKP